MVGFHWPERFWNVKNYPNLIWFDLFHSVSVIKFFRNSSEYWWLNKWEVYLPCWFWRIRTRILKSRVSSTSQRFVLETQFENESNRKVVSQGCLASPLLRHAKRLEKCWCKDSQAASVKISVCQITLVSVRKVQWQYVTWLCYGMPINTGQRKFSSTMFYHNHVLPNVFFS